MGRKNKNASKRSIQVTKVITPHQLKREAERARHLLQGIEETYAHRTREEFTHKVSASLSEDVQAELMAIFQK
jgi:hypothetical protein